MISAHAHDPDRGVAVEVGPGGTLLDLTLDGRALRPGSDLARTILALVDTATARADARAAHALGDLTDLGIRGSAEAEDTTPTTWRV
ncbi:YbaB/EbfC family DNA-binding protein [Saccharothrix sp.]|uniref:YbaB/EbfC family DNA-binding protein n=1 Tax=Saccharothrix sp. TaxID=1873460 RepID=UPI002810C7FE|nr:YbaB/EbfC family DNA-binding protein [Saccharothrix sp.]